MIGCLTETTKCVVAKPLVSIITNELTTLAHDMLKRIQLVIMPALWAVLEEMMSIDVEGHICQDSILTTALL